VIKNNIIGITGYAQHGKNTTGDVLVNEYGYAQFAFADGLREMALRLNPIVGRRRSGVGSRYDRLSDVVASDGWETAKKRPEVRRILQVIGTECVRDMVGEDSWVRVLERKLTNFSGDKAVITDVRFPNEAAWVHQMGGEMWRVVRIATPDGKAFDNGLGTSHPSEMYVADLPVDRVIKAVTVDELRDVVRTIMNDDNTHAWAIDEFAQPWGWG
jgi:hypothetical protein